jgi:DNA-binding LytR/AlgR family response regulator
MSWQDTDMSPAAGTARRVLLHLEDGRRVPVEPDEVFYLEAQADETEVRTRGRRRLRDVRSLAELTARFPKGLLVPVHRSAAVNVDRVDEVRRRANGRDWELRLEPPVNRVIPVARKRVAALWAAYGDEVPRG